MLRGRLQICIFRKGKIPAERGPGAGQAGQGDHESSWRPAQAGSKAREQQQEAERLLAEAEACRDRARLEDLSIWILEKVKSTKKGSRSYHYWMATWREGSRTRNVHLGSCARMDAEESL